MNHRRSPPSKGPSKNNLFHLSKCFEQVDLFLAERAGRTIAGMPELEPAIKISARQIKTMHISYFINIAKNPQLAP